MTNLSALALMIVFVTVVVIVMEKIGLK